jgi:hypothetical protein
MTNFKEILNTLVTVLTAGAVSTVISSGVLYLTSSREHDAKMVEMALGILRAAPNENVTAARSWAIRVINGHSGTPFTADEEKALLKNSIPYIPSLDFRDPRNSQYVPLISP